MPRKRVKAGPGRPKKWPEDLVPFSIHIPKSYKDKFHEARGNIPASEFFVMMMDHANYNVLELAKEVREWKNRAIELEKENLKVKEENTRLKQENEKLLKENIALKEENKALKAEIAELKKQLKMSTRDKDAIELKQEIHALLDEHKELKLIDLLQKLGYEGDYKKHAKAFLKRWFIQQGYSFVSEELGLVIKPVHGFGELAWKVKKLEVKANV